MSDERSRNLRDPARTPRGAASTEDRSRDEPREISDDVRIAAFRARQFQYVLPDLPEMPGYKCVWLSTTAEQDTIRQREIDGYIPVHPDDIPGWNHPGASDAGTPGTINVREMRAYKLPISLWREYMSINHHERPAAQDEKLLAQIDTRVAGGRSLSEQTDRGEPSGIQELREGQRVRSPFL